MRIVYAEFHSELENKIIYSFARRNGDDVIFENQQLALPIIVNTTGLKFHKLIKVLGRPHYKELFELQRYRVTSGYAQKTLSHKITRIMKYVSEGELDAIVLYNKNDDIALIRRYFKESVQEIKLAKRRKNGK